MRLVVADTGPLNYLAQIEAVSVLPRLFGTILIPAAVYSELTVAAAPFAVRALILSGVDWLEVRPDLRLTEISAPGLDGGESAAIALALSVHADLVLMDDRLGVTFARKVGLVVTGTLGVLDLAAERGFIDVLVAIERLKATNFRYPPEVMEALATRHHPRDS